MPLIFTEAEISVTLILILILFWTIPVFIDVRFRPKNLRILRILTWTIAVIALAALFLQPYYYKTAEKKDLAIIAQNISQSTRDSLSAHGYEIQTRESYRHAIFSSSIDHLALLDFELQPWELDQIRADTISYQKKDNLSGIIAYETSDPFLGDSLLISLDVKNDTALSLYLSSFNELLDSVQVNSGNESVKFQTLPTAAGKHLFSVIAKAGPDTLYQEEIPVIINPARQLSILMLNSYPNFESRFFKNYLSDEGYQVAVRTTVSRAISNKEFINMDQVSLNTLSEKALERFEIIVLDPGAFKKLNSTERKNIMALVEQGKIGLLLINASPQEAGAILDEQLVNISPTTWQESEDITWYSIAESNLSPVQYQAQTIGYFKSTGVGKIGFTTTKGLYKLQLGGDQKLYQSLLKKVLQPVLPMEQRSGFVSFEEPVMVDFPMEIGLTSHAETPLLHVSDVQLPVMESPFRPGFFTTTYWPEKVGWHTFLVLPDSVKKDFYVHKKNGWEALRKHRLSTYNTLAARSFQNGDQPALREKAHVSRWILFFVVVICFGLLWAEQKFVNP